MYPFQDKHNLYRKTKLHKSFDDSMLSLYPASSGHFPDMTKNC